MEKQFKKGFFEFIAAADAEKVHSQTIGWIFSENCEVFDDNDKSSMLKELINVENEKIDFIPTRVDVEISDIDILITCGDKLIIIENKIKSSQHSNQLFKYKYITEKNKEKALAYYEKWKGLEFTEDFKNACWLADDKILNELIQKLEEEKKKKAKYFFDNLKKPKYPEYLKVEKSYYIYLSLVDENPKTLEDERKEDKWIPVKYSILYKVLDKYFRIKYDKTIEHHAIVNSYLSTINNLSSATKAFIDNPQEFAFVFNEDKKSKADDSELNTPAGYIKNCKMQTILQKCFYIDCLEKIKKENEELLINFETSVGETHGIALLDFYFKEIKFTFNDIIYKPILQFQGKAIKLALAAPKKGREPNNYEIDNFKKYFAERLAKSQEFKKLLNFDKDDENFITDITSKISNPKSVDGFFSFNLNEKDEYWQVKHNNPENFIKNKIELAKRIFTKDISNS